VFLAVGADSSILEMTPPIRGLALADLRDMFQEVHNGHPHEAIDIHGAERDTRACGGIRNRPQTLPQQTGRQHDIPVRRNGSVLLLLRALGRYAEGLREGMRVERGDVIGFVGSTGNADARTPHLHFAIFELGPERLWWKGKAIDPYPLAW
jgi:hypothetical protein